MYKKYEQMIRGLARDFFPNYEDAEDAIQEINIKLAESPDKNLPEEEEGAWMYVVISNACKDYLRKLKRQKLQAPIIEEELIDTNDPFEYAAQLETAVTLASNYSKLPPLIREACYLRYQKGLSYEAIAQAQGIPIGTVGSRLSRAKDMLADEQ